jgi:hypothetical protein
MRPPAGSRSNSPPGAWPAPFESRYLVVSAALLDTALARGHLLGTNVERTQYRVTPGQVVFFPRGLSSRPRRLPGPSGTRPRCRFPRVADEGHNNKEFGP